MDAGGIGLRPIRDSNNAAIFKLCWDVVSSNSQCAGFLQARFLRNKSPIHYHIRSSLWFGLKNFIHSVLDNMSWLIGDGISINFWFDSWISRPITEVLGIPAEMHDSLKASVADFIVNGTWSFPPDLKADHHALIADIEEKMVIPHYPVPDQPVRSLSDSGNLTFKDVFLYLKPSLNSVSWGKIIWKGCIPPSRSFLLWRILHDRLPTDDMLWRRGCVTVSVCILCCNAFETTNHLFLQCQFAQSLWSWLSDIMCCC